MEMLKKFFPLSFKYADTVANLIIGILIYLVAGAVAVAIAPSVMSCGTLKTSGIMRCTT